MTYFLCFLAGAIFTAAIAFVWAALCLARDVAEHERNQP